MEFTMKIKYFLSVLLIFLTTIYSQAINVPKKISEEFLKLYPGVTKSQWDKEGNNYEVNFTKDKKEMSLLFNSEGKILETETAIIINDLPDGVEKFISDLHPGYKITETAKIVKSNGEVFFETEITKGKESKDLLFDENGKLEKNDSENEDTQDEY
jgi:hypothetical protein